VLARVGLAFVDVQFATLATVALWTVADELAHAILTTTSVQTRVRLAFVHVAQAACVKVTARTVAFEAVNQIGALA